MLTDPTRLFESVVVITVPHMDDGVLACGGTIARLPQKDRIHIVYATDGTGSPAPVLPWCDSVSPDLSAVRKKEAKAAMMCLGVLEKNIHFLDLPDGHLKSHVKTLSHLMTELLASIRPTHVLAPFRFDCHADHLALNYAVTDVLRRNSYKAEQSEYFVYYRWRLLPERDVRKYIRREHLFEIDIESVSEQKRLALGCFKTQTTEYFPWQTRPNLPPRLLDEVSQTPEFFLRHDETLPGASVFARAVPWILLVHKLEPYLKRRKDHCVALWRRGIHRNE